MSMQHVYGQAALDRALMGGATEIALHGERLYSIGGQYAEEVHLTLYDHAHLDAWGPIVVEAHAHSTVLAYGSAVVYADGDSTVWAYSQATVYAYDRARVILYGESSVKAFGSARVERHGNGAVELLETASVTAATNRTQLEAEGTQ